MGYQALLFCPDEKLARVVSQVFTELDFSIEHVHEPFGAVKRLMSQRFDAVVVDCENEPNATLLFKSARNSSANQSSLSIALVEGQAGVAKAYRIGANLVLTKPINVDHAKGTLRVARGLLRKNSDASAAPASVNPPVAPPVAVTPIVPQASLPIHNGMEPMSVPAHPATLPEFEATRLAMSASAKAEESAVAVATMESKPAPPSAAEPLPEKQLQVADLDKPRPVPVPPRTLETSTTFAAQGTAAAPAPAKEKPPEKKTVETVEFEAAYQKDGSGAKFDTAAATTNDGPMFTGLDEEKASSTGHKKILFAVAAVVLFAALGYVGWTKLSGPKATVATPLASQPQSMSAPAPASTPPASTPVTLSLTDRTTNLSTGTSKSASTAPTSTPAAGTSSPALRIDVNSKPEPKNLDVTRIVLKPAPGKQPSARSDETQLPSPLAVGASSDSSLSSLTDVTLRSQPSLAKVNISQGVSQGLLIKRVQPRYPQNALAMHVQGGVQLDAMIDKEGKIVNLKVLKGDPVLAHAAVDAVKQWRYKPYYLDGVPVDIQTQITVNFRLPN